MTAIVMSWTVMMLMGSALCISVVSAFITSSSDLYGASNTHTCRTTILYANPLEGLFQKKDKEQTNGAEFTSAKEAEAMHRTAKMMEDHRRSQEVSERTAAIMEELTSSQVVGKSKAGVGGGIGIGDGRKGGVKATFNGKQQPLDVVVDPKFLFNGAEGVISIDELNEAISDAVQNGYELSTKLMEEQIKGLYEQLGLSKEPQILPTDD